MECGASKQYGKCRLTSVDGRTQNAERTRRKPFLSNSISYSVLNFVKRLQNKEFILYALYITKKTNFNFKYLDLNPVQSTLIEQLFPIICVVIKNSVCFSSFLVLISSPLGPGGYVTFSVFFPYGLLAVFHIFRHKRDSVWISSGACLEPFWRPSFLPSFF